MPHSRHVHVTLPAASSRFRTKMPLHLVKGHATPCCRHLKFKDSANPHLEEFVVGDVNLFGTAGTLAVKGTHLKKHTQSQPSKNLSHRESHLQHAPGLHQVDIRHRQLLISFDILQRPHRHHTSCNKRTRVHCVSALGPVPEKQQFGSQE